MQKSVTLLRPTSSAKVFPRMIRGVEDTINVIIKEGDLYPVWLAKLHMIMNILYSTKVLWTREGLKDFFEKIVITDNDATKILMEEFSKTVSFLANFSFQKHEDYVNLATAFYNYGSLLDEILKEALEVQLEDKGLEEIRQNHIALLQAQAKYIIDCTMVGEDFNQGVYWTYPLYLPTLQADQGNWRQLIMQNFVDITNADELEEYNGRYIRLDLITDNRPDFSNDELFDMMEEIQAAELIVSYSEAKSEMEDLLIKSDSIILDNPEIGVDAKLAIKELDGLQANKSVVQALVGATHDASQAPSSRAHPKNKQIKIRRAIASEVENKEQGKSKRDRAIVVSPAQIKGSSGRSKRP